MFWNQDISQTNTPGLKRYIPHTFLVNITFVLHCPYQIYTIQNDYKANAVFYFDTKTTESVFASLDAKPHYLQLTLGVVWCLTKDFLTQVLS